MKLTKLFQVSLAAIAVLATAGTAHATSFALGNQSARGMGRANAIVADPKDASTIWYNPAGLTQLDGKLNIYAGAILINPHYSYQPFDGGKTTDGDSSAQVSPHVYLAGRVSRALVLGLGFTPAYGATVKWGADSPGRTLIREQSLRSLWFQPTVALDFAAFGIKGLSAGAALDLVYTTAYLSQDIAFGQNTYGKANLSGHGFNVGGHFGLLYKPEWFKGLAIGAKYTLPVRTSLSGTTDFDAPAAVRGQLPPDGKGKVDGVDMPQQAIFGLGYTFFERLNIEADGIWNNWRDLTRLQFTFPDGSQQINQRLYQNRFGVRTGIEFRGDCFAVRGGYEYDPTPIPKQTLDFTLPDVNRNSISAGFSLFLPADFWVDVGGWSMIPRSRDTERTPTAIQPIVGTYRVAAWEIGLSVGLALGKAKEAPKEEVADVPLVDTDADGVPDANDACPMVAGNDGTGCPVPVDADNDGVMDNVDKCPGVTGVAPDGCPPPDSDGDGVIDANDACPTEKGDMANGCPNPDPDNDGVLGAADVCPNEPETKNGYQDNDGCPDELPAAVAKFNGKLEGVRFATGSSRLTRDSSPALDAIAKTLKEYPELRLEIAGYTDNVGNPEKNKALSQARADSVRNYLEAHGVAGDRLNAIGYGAENPVADNATKVGQAANRRIEFKILQN